ncbi:hypothetical protein Cgig2_020921 [Carnegiea gigantea]|uniref:Uncharacterized protein n=1 Tax=Carnegiea gigantea TaxID=171969 RepID=A0A9Q1GWE9_9CARY|nr:hypothetical protein Cgig2_020921 [Carnegiea gigantea]
MTCNKLLFLIERLDHTRWIATMETGFGGGNTLKLSDSRILKITKKDVHATLALSMGPLDVQRTRWNLERIGTPKVGTMVEQILQRGNHGEEFKRDFVLYIISICIIESMNGYHFFRILKLLVDVYQIASYNWCAFLLVEFKGKRSIYRTTDAVEQRNKDEKEFPREHGRAKTIDRIDY